MDYFHRYHNKGKFIRHFIFGAEDGLISTLGFLSGITGAGFSHIVIVIAGIAEIFAAALSMAIGTYLSTKSYVELLNRNIELEKSQIEKTPAAVKKEIKRIYKKKGFKEPELNKIVQKICSNKNIWLNEIIVSELGIIPGRVENPFKAAIVMFFTFFILALIPLIPYLILPVSQAIILSIILTVCALFIVGALKTTLTKKTWWKAGLEMMILGIIAAIITFYTGEFISTLY